MGIFDDFIEMTEVLTVGQLCDAYAMVDVRRDYLFVPTRTLLDLPVFRPPEFRIGLSMGGFTVRPRAVQIVTDLGPEPRASTTDFVGRTAAQIRLVAKTFGTSEHYGENDGPVVDVELFKQAAKVCDRPFTGGDFDAWLFFDDGLDW